MKWVALASFFVGTLCAITNQELFLRANKEFHDGNYAHALKDYEAVTHKASAVLYNMGICFYKSGQLSQALACFKHAQRIATRATIQAIMENSDRVARRMQVYQAPSSIARIDGCIRSQTAGTSLLQWQVIFLFLLYLGAFIVWRSKKRVRCLVLGCCVMACAVSVIPILRVKWIDTHVYTGIVINKSMAVYSGPYNHCHEQGTLVAGQEVAILQIRDGWYKIRYGTILGWVPQELLAPTF